MDKSVVAYSFNLLEEGDSGAFEGSVSSAHARTFGRMVTAFASSETCRNTMRSTPATVPVIVCNHWGSVTPVNLAAALCADAPERDVYFMEDSPTQALASQARAAGVRGIINSTQAQKLLDVSQGFEPTPAVTPAARPAAPPAAPVHVAPISATTPAAPILAHHTTQGRVVGFFSGRGGVGKSVVALMTALTAQRDGARVALVDLDLQFGDLDYLAGNEPSSRIQRLMLEDCCRDIQSYPLKNEALTLIVPPAQPEQGESFAAAIPHLLADLAQQRDLVVVNTGAFWTEVHALMVQRCDHLVILMDQRATSVEACKQVVDLCSRMQVPQARFLFLLNGCGRHAALTPLDVTLALGGVEVMGLADGGSLVDELLALGCPMELLGSKNAFVASLEVALNTLMGNSAGSLSGSSSGNRLNSALTQLKSHNNKKGSLLDWSAMRNLFGGAHRVAS